jgi:hypothetical protein
MNKLATSALALAISLTATLTVSAGPAHAGDPAAQSARWLNKQHTDGLVHNDQFDFDDYGLSIDVGIALGELDLPQSAKKVSKAVAANIDSYTTGADFGSSDIYANATAKAAAFALTTGADPTDFGGVDLIKRLTKRVAKDGPIRGRIQDKSAGDFANVIGQSLAVQALLLAKPSRRGLEALGFLASQQCKAGYFRLNFTANKAAKDQTCDGGKRKSTSAPDTDATALAVLSLLELPAPRGALVNKAITKAVDWLVKTQAKNGSFGGGASTEAPNANSTGLAARALAATGECDRANKAVSWLGKLTVNDVSGENGAIAYDKAALATAQDGISDAERDQFVRATAQAAPALAVLVINPCD